MSDKQQIGNRIRTLRKRRRWSQEQLVEKAREFVPPGRVLNRESISYYENGHSYPDNWSAVAIARALGVTVEYLLGAQRVALLTPEPEIWDTVERVNKQPPYVRRLLAKLVESALELLAAASSFPPETQAHDEQAEQVPAPEGELPIVAVNVSNLAQALGRNAEVELDSLLSDDAESAPRDDSEHRGEGRRSGR